MTVEAKIQFTIDVHGGIVLTSPPPPIVVGAGQPYTHTFVAAGVAVNPPFKWTVNLLPSWLRLTVNADGTQAVLSGTAPTTQGPQVVSLTVGSP